MVGLSERRQHPRAAFTGITLVRAGEQEIPCVAGNLSETGILLHPRMSRELDDAFHVAFTLPTVSGWIVLEGTLVRSHQIRRRIEWGVRFIDVPESVQTILRDYVGQPDGAAPPDHSRGDEPSVRVVDEEEIPLPPAIPPSRRERVTTPLRAQQRPTRAASPGVTLPPPRPTTDVMVFAPSHVDLTGEELPVEGPTSVTLLDDLDDLDNADAPTLVTPRDDVDPPADNPTRVASSREAWGLRDRCRKN